MNIYGDVVWSFRTKRLLVELRVERINNYRYDGDDEDGETQAALDAGELVAFDSSVSIYLRNGPDEPIASNHLGENIYYADRESEFWADHRDKDPMNRNCSIMRASRGDNVSICHYFPDMVFQAIEEARKALPKSKGSVK